MCLCGCLQRSAHSDSVLKYVQYIEVDCNEQKAKVYLWKGDNYDS